jgi:putative salt-induced outer membrane protein YdiY
MHRPALLAAAFVALAASPAFADTVKLKNGDTLTGKVVTVLDGTLTFKSDSLGEVKLALAQIETLATDDPITIELRGGTIVRGKAVAEKDGAFEIADGGTKQEITLANVASVNKPPRHWTGNVLGAATWTTGNSESTAISLDANAVNRGDVDRITLDGWYRATRAKDQTTGVTSTSMRQLGADAKYDYFISGTKAYAYGNGKADKDGIADIDLRLVAGAGGGYQFLESDATKLSAEAGMSWVYINYSGPTSTASDPALRVAGDFTHNFSETVAFFDDAEVLKIFSGAHDYLAHNRAGLREKLTGSFFAQQWVDWSWNTQPAAGKERVDMIYYIGVGWTF